MVAIIIPTYNEDALIEKTLHNLTLDLKLDYRIIIVDDGSSDNTVTIIKRFAQSRSNITIISNKIHRGYSEVLKQGFEAVKEGEVLVTLMADGCDDVTILKDMYHQIYHGADIVCASRYIKGGKRIGGSRIKACGSWFVNRLVSSLKKIPCHDLTNSFKMVKKEVLNSIDIESVAFEFFLELILKAYIRGFTIVEIPTVWKERQEGRSKFQLYRNGIRYWKWIYYGFRHI
ncbi:MAG: glycosyltransferase [Candidatus Omnitrophica bacterium]|nr:glycosyltransferase [Candidatus Omnitrophota bacterium]